MQAPVAEAGLRIRRPPSMVYEAFVDSEVTSKFWFTDGSGRLEPGATVEWRWSLYAAATSVEVLALEPDRRILVAWDGREGHTTVERRLRDLGDDGTYVDVRNAGFVGSDDAVVAEALDAAGGFARVLAGAKAWLEHGLALRLVEGRFPPADPPRDHDP